MYCDLWLDQIDLPQAADPLAHLSGYRRRDQSRRSRHVLLSVDAFRHAYSHYRYHCHMQVEDDEDIRTLYVHVLLCLPSDCVMHGIGTYIMHLRQKIVATKM